MVTIKRRESSEDSDIRVIILVDVREGSVYPSQLVEVIKVLFQIKYIYLITIISVIST